MRLGDRHAGRGEEVAKRTRPVATRDTPRAVSSSSRVASNDLISRARRFPPAASRTFIACSASSTVRARPAPAPWRVRKRYRECGPSGTISAVRLSSSTRRYA